MSNPPGLPPYQTRQPRRFSSYASVAAGQGQNEVPFTQLPQPNQRYSGSYNPSGVIGTAMAALNYSHSGHSRQRGGGSLDAGMGTGSNAEGIGSGLSSSWGRTGYHSSTMAGGSGSVGSGPYGTPWAGLASAASAAGLGEDPTSRVPPFFIPSYLKGTRQARRLEEAHNARLNAHRDATRSAHSSNAASLSTSSSSLNVHKMVPSHRGMTHDIIERAAPASVEEAPAPLPSRWQLGHEVTGMDLLNGGTEARYSGLTKQHDEAAGVRGDVPIPRECGIFYYEVTVGTKQKENSVQIAIGFTSPKVTSRRMPGWEPDSYGYAADDGCLLLGNSNSPKKYGPPYANGDVIGAGINFHKNHIFFTKNGNHLGPVVTGARTDRLYAAVGLKRAGDHVRVNFGQGGFVFDIDSLVEAEREEVHQEMMAHPIDTLSPPLTEPQLIHKLIAQYLAHDGYIETARAFAAEVRQEQHSLSVGTNASSQMIPQDLEPEEDVDAIHRQNCLEIRSAILDGDIDRALKYTQVYYPDVLRENENIYFKLKCRKFIEMIRRCAELSDGDAAPVPSKISPAASRTGLDEDDDHYNGVFDHQMELDASMHQNGSSHASKWSENMETSTSSLDQQPVSYTEMITKTLQYGSELKAEFDADPRREVKKALEETLALIGYEDPRVSPLGGLLDEAGRGPVAEELNRGILVSLGKSSSSAIENVFAQTDVLLDIIGKDGGPGALIDLRSSTSRSGVPL